MEWLSPYILMEATLPPPKKKIIHIVEESQSMSGQAVGDEILHILAGGHSPPETKGQAYVNVRAIKK